MLGVLFTFYIQCSNLVTEKEKKLKLQMKMMGTRDTSMWLSWCARAQHTAAHRSTLQHTPRSSHCAAHTAAHHASTPRQHTAPATQ